MGGFICIGGWPRSRRVLRMKGGGSGWEWVGGVEKGEGNRGQKIVMVH